MCSRHARAPRGGPMHDATIDETVQTDSDVRYRAIVQSALDAIIVIDAAGLIREFNPAAERIFGWTREQVTGSDVAIVIPPDMRDRHHRGFHHHLKSGTGTLLDRRLELIAIRADGETFPVEMTVTRSDLTSTPHFTAFIRDLTEQHRLAAAVADHASHDVVTGLQRYAVFEPRLISMIGDGSAFLAVMFIDLDRFQGINESIGHEQADEVLMAIGARLQTAESEHVAVCHFASDEFVLVQEGGDGGSAIAFAE